MFLKQQRVRSKDVFYKNKKTSLEVFCFCAPAGIVEEFVNSSGFINDSPSWLAFSELRSNRF